MGQTIACVNQKGGVGKTTTVVNLATALALHGRRILVVDLDPQGNATSGFGVNRNEVSRSLYDALIDGLPLRDVVIPDVVAGLSLAPSSIALSGAEVELVTRTGGIDASVSCSGPSPINTTGSSWMVPRHWDCSPSTH